MNPSQSKPGSGRNYRDMGRAIGRQARPSIRPKPSVEDPPPPPLAAAPTIPTEIQVFYQPTRKALWALNARGEWIQQTETAIKRLLRSLGYRQDAWSARGLTIVEEKLLEIMQEHDVEYAGPIAGYQTGLHQAGNRRVLVTKGPTLPRPARGKWEALKTYLSELLGDQLPYLFGWIRSACQSLHAGPPWRPGQMLAVAGPPGCGKTLLQGIITEILGGRSISPYRYLIGQSTFNGDLLQNEHLAISDEPASTDTRARKHFGGQLKNLIANDVQSINPKGLEAMPFSPFWRVSISLNERPEDLMVLPPLDESIRDKVILLKASPTRLPFDAEHPDQRRAFRSALSAELPGFLFHLLRTWKPSAENLDQRWGVRSWQHPELTQEVHALSPEFRLLEIADDCDVTTSLCPQWEGSARELYRLLLERDKTGEVGRLCSGPSTVGVYLGRLKANGSNRIDQKRGPDNTSLWIVRRV